MSEPENKPEPPAEHSDEVVIRRRRSKHHRHHRHHGFRMEDAASARAMEDRHALLYIIPILMLGIGFFLWKDCVSQPDPALRPKDLLILSRILLGGGGFFLFVVLLSDWIRKVRENAENRRED